MTFCCTVDVVTKRLPVTQTVKFSALREKLLQIMGEDQLERSSPDFFSQDPQLIKATAKREAERAQHVVTILETIKTPSVANIGLDGSRAVWLIALHSPEYQDLGKRVLSKMRYLYYKDKNSVFYPGIPYLVDRLMVSSKQFDHAAKQLYGTQRWFRRYDNGKTESGRYEIINPNQLGDRLVRLDLANYKTCRHRQ